MRLQREGGGVEGEEAQVGRLGFPSLCTGTPATRAAG